MRALSWFAIALLYCAVIWLWVGKMDRPKKGVSLVATRDYMQVVPIPTGEDGVYLIGVQKRLSPWEKLSVLQAAGVNWDDLNKKIMD